MLAVTDPVRQAEQHSVVARIEDYHFPFEFLLYRGCSRERGGSYRFQVSWQQQSVDLSRCQFTRVYSITFTRDRLPFTPFNSKNRNKDKDREGGGSDIFLSLFGVFFAQRSSAALSETIKA